MAISGRGAPAAAPLLSRRGRRAPAMLLTRVALPAIVLLGTGCGGPTPSAAGPSSGRLQVAAAENFWGSIAAQLGGDAVTVSSIIVNPSTDPHSYEATAADGVTIARSQMAIVNGIGYDTWASKLLAANPSRGRVVLDVGDELGLKQGANPHQWYSPASVRGVVDAIVRDYTRLEPKDAGYFARRRISFLTGDLAEYDRLRAEIRARYAGVTVGYSESVFEPLGRSLGLKLATPYSFAKALAEGTDVSAQDKQTVDRQAETHAIRVWVYNSQNATPDVQRVNQLAREAHIPITTITETLAPASASFEQWQSAQLRELMAALRTARTR